LKPIESEMSEVASLRKQVRMLAIVLFGAYVLLLASLSREFVAHPSSDTGWPDLSANKLQVKQVVLMTDDGKPAGLLKVIDGSSGIALLDAKGEVRILLTTAKNSGIIKLSSEGASVSTYLQNGEIAMGDEKVGGVVVKSSPVGEPVVKLFDSSGYGAALGRSLVVSKVNGTVSETSAASLMGSSKDSASTWTLLSQPDLRSTQVNESHGDSPKTSLTTPPKNRN